MIPLGQTALVLGFGHIGREIARIMRALGSHVIGVSRTGAPDSGADEDAADRQARRRAARAADSIMISLPLDSATHHLINARTLALCKKNAIIVNIARGGIIDQIALTEALKNGTIAGAGLDVTDPEPLPPERSAVGRAEPATSRRTCAGGAGSVTTDRIAGAAADNLRALPARRGAEECGEGVSRHCEERTGDEAISVRNAARGLLRGLTLRNDEVETKRREK